MASSIQPNLAASRTRHCSRVMVRYHGNGRRQSPAAAIDECINPPKADPPLRAARVAGRRHILQSSRVRTTMRRRPSMSVDVGAKAPDFTLPNQDREPVTLSEQLKTGRSSWRSSRRHYSGTCQKEMCTFRDSASSIEQVKAKVLGSQRRHVLRAEGVGRRRKAELPAAQRLQQRGDSRSTASSIPT